MTTDNQPSVVLLTNSFAPYRIPFYNELSKHSELLVSVDVEREQHREWAINDGDFGFPWVGTRSLALPRANARQEGHVLVPLNIGAILSRFRPDLVISSELGVRTASAAAYCRTHKRPLTIWWEGTLDTEASAGRLTKLRRRVLLRQATRTWGNGEGSAEYFASCGIPQSRVDLGMTGIDTPSWRSEVDHARVETSSSVRERFGLQGSVLLFVGRLTARKGIPELLHALSLLAADPSLPPWSVLFVGSGPLTEAIEAWTLLHPQVPVGVTGFVQPPRLAAYYGAADLFVMPSLEDCWALVCLEAVTAGLPQVTSRLTGSAMDLVTSPEIGEIIDPTDTRSFAHSLSTRIRTGPQPLPSAIRDRIVERWSTTAMADRALRSIHAALRGDA